MDSSQQASAVPSNFKALPALLARTARGWLADWPVWWQEQSAFSKWAPLVFFVLYWTVLYAIHGLRSDHILIGCAFLAMSYLGRGARIIRAFLFPLIATGILYDSQRWYSDYIRGAIHVEQPYHFDKKFFGISTAAGVLTPNEFWQLHTRWYLDLICGFAYLVFIGVFVCTCALFRFWYAKKGTAKMSAREIFQRAPAMMWSFFWVNMIGYSTYYWYAAAPPWYVAKYGFGPARMDVGPSQAGCVRFDQLMGTHFFSDFYGKSADVFGAIPSLHVSYPLIAAIFAFRFGALRIPTVLFYLLMCFSAVYLNHHYILDVLCGSLYGTVIAFVVDLYYKRKMSLSTSAVQ